VHYLWEQHPVFQWLNNKVASGLRRQQAPVVVAGDNLAINETIFITYSLIANQKGQPLIQRWLGVRFINGKFDSVESLENVLTRTGLAKGLPNSGQTATTLTGLKQQLPEVVKQVSEKMTLYRKQFEQENRPKLNAQLDKLQKLEHKHIEQLDIFRESSDQVAAIRSRFEEYRQWIHETMNTEDQPYIQIVAAIVDQ
jgi:hypothetical protein